jgi:ribonuclease Z
MERLYVVGPPAIQQFIEGVLDTTQLRLPYPLEFIRVEGSQQAIEMHPEFYVQASALSHRLPSFAYSFTEKTIEGKLDTVKLKHDGIPTGPAWKQLQQGNDIVLPDGRHVQADAYLFPRRKPRKVIISGDNDTPELLSEAALAADVLVHEATYTQAALDKVGPGPQHSSARKVAQFAHDAGIRNLVLTHFSPRYHGRKEGSALLSEIEEEARSAYKGNLFLANDFDHYSLDKYGVLSKSG